MRWSPPPKKKKKNDPTKCCLQDTAVFCLLFLGEGRIWLKVTISSVSWFAIPQKYITPYSRLYAHGHNKILHSLGMTDVQNWVVIGSPQKVKLQLIA